MSDVSGEVAELLREIRENKAKISENENEIERLKTEIDEGWKQREAELMLMAEHAKVSHHDYRGEYRKGYVMWGSADQHVLDLIAEFFGQDRADALRDDLEDSYKEDAHHLAVLFRYFEYSGAAFLYKFNEGRPISAELALFEERHNPASAATRLLAFCIEFRNRSRTLAEDLNWFEFTGVVAKATIWYHKMSMLPIERKSLHNLDVKAIGRSPYAESRMQLLKLAMNKLSDQSKRGLSKSNSAAAKYALAEIEGFAKDQLPSERTLAGWISDERKVCNQV